MAIYRGSGGSGDATNDATVTAVQTYATQAANSATEAATSATNAATSAAGAATSSTNAANSATDAEGSATTAAGHVSSASTYATNSSLSADDSAASALEAQGYASEAFDYSTAASIYAEDAATSATTANSAASTASSSAAIVSSYGSSLNTVSSNISIISAVASGVVPSRVLVVSSGGSIPVNVDVCDMASQINTASAGTLTITAPTGTPVDGQRLVYRIQCTNAQTLSWNAIFAQSADVSLPTATTGSSKIDYYGFFYNSNATKWQLIAKVTGF